MSACHRRAEPVAGCNMRRPDAHRRKPMRIGSKDKPHEEEAVVEPGELKVLEP